MPLTGPSQLMGPKVLIRKSSAVLTMGDCLRYLLSRLETLGLLRFRSLLADRKSLPSYSMQRTYRGFSARP